MASFSRGEVVLVRYPFSDLSGAKVRPAIIVSPVYPSADLLIVPLTSHILSLRPGEFILQDWRGAGLHVPSAAKRGLATVHESVVVKAVGVAPPADMARLDSSLGQWVGIANSR
jgi:mRNA interferase MazF